MHVQNGPILGGVKQVVCLDALCVGTQGFDIADDVEQVNRIHIYGPCPQQWHR